AGPHTGLLEIFRELVGANQLLGQPVDPSDSRQPVGSAAADRIGHGSRGPAELGADAGAFHVHFGDVQLVHLDAEIAEAHVRDVHAVDQIGVVLAAAAGSRTDGAA